MSDALFVTRLHRGRISVAQDLERTCLVLAAEDRAGQRWSREHGYGGYTSYASLNDLTRRASVFETLASCSSTWPDGAWPSTVSGSM